MKCNKCDYDIDDLIDYKEYADQKVSCPNCQNKMIIEYDEDYDNESREEVGYWQIKGLNMELTEKAAIEVLTTYAPQVGEGNNWNLLIEAIKKLEQEKVPESIYYDKIFFIKETNLFGLDYEKTFWAVVEAINFINELKNGD